MHTRQWTCGYSRGYSVTCNCGVVLRDHNDVIEFNCCNEYLYYDNVTPIRVKVRSKKRLAPGISIRQTFIGFNSKYRVNYCLILFTLRPQYLTTRNISHIFNEAEVNTPFSACFCLRKIIFLEIVLLVRHSLQPGQNIKQSSILPSNRSPLIIGSNSCLQLCWIPHCWNFVR